MQWEMIAKIQIESTPLGGLFTASVAKRKQPVIWDLPLLVSRASEGDSPRLSTLQGQPVSFVAPHTQTTVV